MQFLFEAGEEEVEFGRVLLEAGGVDDEAVGCR